MYLNTHMWEVFLFRVIEALGGKWVLRGSKVVSVTSVDQDQKVNARKLGKK